MLDTTDPKRPRARPLAGALARIVRARAVNPRFIAGQMRHGPRGAAELAETVDRLIGFAQMTDAVQRLWNHLSALDRRVIELRLEGHSTADAARLLNEDPDRLRVRLNRLRRQVRESGLFDDWL